MLAPERITLYCRKKDKDGVYHAFPVDSSNPDHSTAKSWSSESHGYWENGKYIRVAPTPGTVFEFDNQGFTDVKIESLDIRGQGGRAYQVILEVAGNKFRVDLREDTLLDVIWNTGIRAGGWLNGCFCFVKDGAQTKLIREGTELHKRAIAEREKRETFTKNISRKDLKPGYKYKTISNDTAIFLGFVYTVSLSKGNGDVSTPQKHMLFIKHYDEDVKDLIHKGKLNYSDHEDVSDRYAKASCCDFILSKNHSFRIEEEQVIDDVNLPNFVESIKNMAQLEYIRKMNTKLYSRYFDSFKDAYQMSVMAVDKKDVRADSEAGRNIIRKCNEYYNNRWY